jgi:hypothetical protein
MGSKGNGDYNMPDDIMLEPQYAKPEEIPEAFRGLYEERGGVHMLTKIKGIATTADVTRVQRALDSEKKDHTTLKTNWSSFFGDKKPEDIRAILDRVPELETIAASKNINDEKLNELAETRFRAKFAPLERELGQLKTSVGEKDAVIQQYAERERTRTIHDGVRAEATKSKVVDTALEDVLMLAERAFEVDDKGNLVTRDLPGQTPGLQPSVWLTEMQAKRPHWWPASKGGGAGGGVHGSMNAADNPFSAAGWNMTAQGRIYQENPERARQLAQVAGTTVGGPRPAASK